MNPAETDLGGGVLLRYSYLEERLLAAKPDTALEDLGGGVEKRLAEALPPEYDDRIGGGENKLVDEYPENEDAVPPTPTLLPAAG